MRPYKTRAGAVRQLNTLRHDAWFLAAWRRVKAVEGGYVVVCSFPDGHVLALGARNTSVQGAAALRLYGWETT